MNNVSNVVPKNKLINNVTPRNNLINNATPKNKLLRDTNFIYLETRTILKGQPLPWGINWAITYPATLVFQGVRI